MGSGIAFTTAQSGYYTRLLDLNADMLEKARQSHAKWLQQSVEKGRLTPDQAQETSERIVYTQDLNEGIADLIIEAIVEKKEAKVNLFNQLAEINHSETFFASNTSSLSITELAKGIVHPQRVAGLHFFNPAHIMKLVEVVAGEQTNAQLIQTLVDFCASLDKKPVVCKDAPGFIVNRVARPYYIESLRLAEAGIPLQDIDAAMQAAGFRMGPFALMDLIGNDINFAVSNLVYDQLQQPERLRPSYLQQQLVEAGKLGVKSGAGYYPYPQKKD